jgi:hypothetical protein
LVTAFSLTTHLLAFAMTLQAAEIFLLTRQEEFRAIWSWTNLEPDLSRGLPLPPHILSAVFSNLGLAVIAVVQLLASAAAFYFPSPYLFALLALTHLLICIRFRGSFNGGSDMMTFVVLTGVLIALIGGEEKFIKWGLLYVTIHVLYAYFKAGLAKIQQPEWRLGLVIPAFLEKSLYPEIRDFGRLLRGRPSLALVMSWGVMGFELSAIALPFVPEDVAVYFAVAVSFHFLNYLAFGLNRFFWIWLCAWPAVFYSLSMLSGQS